MARPVCLLVLLLALAAVVRQVAGLSDRALEWNWLNGDTLFPFHLARDLLYDGYPLAGWSFPVAPFLFPDCALALVSLGVAGNNVALAALIYGVVQYALIVGGAIACLRAVRLPGRRRAECGVLLAAAGLALIVALGGSHVWPAPFLNVPPDGDRTYVSGAAPHQLFLCQYHSGTWAAALWAGAAGLWLLRRGVGDTKGRVVLAGLLVVVALTSLSNLLFLAWFVLPFLLAGGLAWRGGAVPLRRWLGLALVVLIAAALGRWLAGRLVSVPVGEQATFSRDLIRAAWRHLRQDYLANLRGADLFHAAATAWLIFAVFHLWRNRHRATRSFTLVAFVTLAAVGSFAAIIAGGMNPNYPPWHFYAWGQKYFHPLFFGPIFFGAALLAAKFGRPLKFVPAGALVAAALVLLTRPPAVRPWDDWRPEFVRLLDEQARAGGPRDGVAEFWSARLITLFSKEGVRAVPLNPIVGSVVPVDSLNNRHWRERNPAYGFYVAGVHPIGLWHEEKIRGLYGEPARTFRATDRNIWLYGRPGDTAFRDFFNTPWRCRLLLANELPGDTGERTPLVRIACAGEHPAGDLVKAGFAPRPAPGRYRFRIATSDLTGDTPAAWELRAGRVLLRGDLHAEQTEDEGTIYLPAGDEPLDVIVRYHGRGSAGVRRLELWRED